MDVQAALAGFGDALARAGMSVAVAPRACTPGVDEVTAPPSCAPRWDDDVACVVLPPAAAGCDRDGVARAALVTYARALVKAHLPGAPAARAAALVEAYSAHDDAKLAALARAVEADFDALRSTAPVKVARHEHHARHKPAPAKAPVDAGPPADGAGAPHADTAAPAGDEDEGDGDGEEEEQGPGAPSLHDRLVGTWTYDEGPLRNVNALCDDGAYAVRYEAAGAGDGDFDPDDMPTVHGTWKAEEDPPRVAFSAFGEHVDAPVRGLTDDTLDLDFDGEAIHLERRSKTATCE